MEKQLLITDKRAMVKFSTFKLIFLLPFFLWGGLDAYAQNVKLNKYTFGEGIKFSGDRGYTVNMTGYVQPFYEGKIFTDTSLAGINNRFRLRRARLRFTGNSPNEKITWRLQADLSGSAEVEGAATLFLMDAWVGYNFAPRWKVRFGQKNTPTDNRELLIRSYSLQMVERSRVTSAFSTIREFGVFLDGTIPLQKGWYLRPNLTITNGDGGNVFTGDHGGFKYGGRLEVLPFGLFTNMGQFHEADVMRELSPKLVFGVAYSYNDGMSSRRGRESGTVMYFDSNYVESLPDYTKLCVDFMFKYNGFSALGEFVVTNATVPDDIYYRQRNDGSFSDNFDVDGVRDVDNYVKGRMMLGAGYNFQMGYLFKNRISVDARYTHMAADEYSFLNNGTFYNRPNYYTLATTKYFSKGYGFKVSGSVTYAEALEGSNDLEGNPMNGDEWFVRLITSIAF